MDKKGVNILMQNVVYVVLVLAFFAILFAFVGLKASDGALLEERTAKKIALIIDTASSGTKVSLNVEDVLEKNDGVVNPIVIRDNVVSVKLSEKSGYSYGYFSDNNAAYKLEGGFLELEIR